MQSDDKDKKKAGETSKKKEIKKFKELTFDAGSEGSHDSGADLNDDGILRSDSPSKPSQVRSVIDDRDSPHLRRFIQSARPGDDGKAGLAVPRPARQTNSDQPVKIEAMQEVLSASCDVLLQETNTDPSSSSSSSKPTAIVKPCHKQEPGEKVPVIEEEIKEPEKHQLQPEEDQTKVKTNQSDDFNKTSVAEIIDSVSAENELDTTRAAVNCAVIDQSNAEDENGHQSDANTGVIAQAEKLLR